MRNSGKLYGEIARGNALSPEMIAAYGLLAPATSENT